MTDRSGLCKYVRRLFSWFEQWQEPPFRSVEDWAHHFRSVFADLEYLAKGPPVTPGRVSDFFAAVYSSLITNQNPRMSLGLLVRLPSGLGVEKAVPPVGAGVAAGRPANWYVAAAPQERSETKDSCPDTTGQISFRRPPSGAVFALLRS